MNLPFAALLLLTSSIGGCHSAASTGTRSAAAAHEQCDNLNSMGSRLTDPDTGLARQEAVVSATLLSQVPRITSENIATADELLVVMVKQNPYSPEGVTLFFLNRYATPFVFCDTTLVLRSSMRERSSSTPATLTPKSAKSWPAA